MKELSIKEQADIISAVPLLKREEIGEYVVYTCLSSNGVDEYRTTLHNGKCVGCTCPATIVRCKHGRACEFEEEWTKPVTAGELAAKKQEMDAVAEQVAPAILGEQFAADLSAHIDDDLSAPLPVARRCSLGDNVRKTEVTPFGRTMLMR